MYICCRSREGEQRNRLERRLWLIRTPTRRRTPDICHDASPHYPSRSYLWARQGLAEFSLKPPPPPSLRIIRAIQSHNGDHGHSNQGDLLRETAGGFDAVCSACPQFSASYVVEFNVLLIPPDREFVSQRTNMSVARPYSWQHALTLS